MKRTSKVALGGVVSSLSLLFMFLTGVIPFATYALPAISGALLIIIVVEYNYKWAYLVYISVSILSVFISPEKDAAAFFIAFFGHYPITKCLLEKIKNRFVEYMLKFLTFNACVISAFTIIVFIFRMNEILSDLGTIGIYGLIIALVLINIVFIIYDIALSRVISAYIHWFRPNFLRKI